MASPFSPAPAAPVYIAPHPAAKAGRRCSVCRHPDITQINSQLVANCKGAVQIAQQYGIHPHALYRHNKKCVPLLIQRERSAIIASQEPVLLPIALAAKEARLKRLQMFAEAQDKILAEKGLLLTKKTKAGRATVTEESYNQKLVSDAVLIQQAIRSELGETHQAAGRGGSQTVVFMPGSLSAAEQLPTTGVQVLLAEAAASAAFAPPPIAQERVSLEGRKGTATKPACDLPMEADQTDVETTTEPVSD